LIAVEDVTVVYGAREVLKDISLSLDNGLFVLLGKNGSGKSTLLKTIAGIIKPSKGRVLVLGKDIHGLSRREAVKLVGYAWQNPYAGFVEATVRDELEFTSRVTGVPLNRNIVEMLVPSHLLDRNPFTLSGGEAKRVSMASVIALDQPVWLLDEPFDYLDDEGVKAVLGVIEYGLSRGKAVVIASANVAYLHALRANKVVILLDGRKVFEGGVGELSDELLSNYGVPSRVVVCGQGSRRGNAAPG